MSKDDVLAWAPLAISALALWLSWRATKHGKTSAIAASKSAAQARRSADAAERQAAAAESLLPPARLPVQWEVGPGHGIGYVLRNVGAVDATNVTVAGHPATAASKVQFNPAGQTIKAGAAAEVQLRAGSGPKVTTLIVSCDELDEPVLVAVP